VNLPRHHCFFDIQENAWEQGQEMAPLASSPVSISCRIKPRMRSSRTGLTDKLLYTASKVDKLFHPAFKTLARLYLLPCPPQHVGAMRFIGRDAIVVPRQIAGHAPLLNFLSVILKYFSLDLG
jgi:hypothetical protein